MLEGGFKQFRLWYTSFSNFFPGNKIWPNIIMKPNTESNHNLHTISQSTFRKNGCPWISANPVWGWQPNRSFGSYGGKKCFKNGWLSCFRIHHPHDLCFVSTIWYLCVWNQNGLPFISRRYNTRFQWVSEACDKISSWLFLQLARN